MINQYIFREYDIRGVYGKDLDEEVAYLIGKAFGTKLRRMGRTITLVGYDNRYSSPCLEKALVRGICECGIHVVCLGLVTTPMYYFGWDLLNIKSGVMVTASHNPKDDNGFKFSYNGINNAYGNSSLELYQMIMNRDFVVSEILGNVRVVNIRREYIKMITSHLRLGERKLKVVYDCGNGTTSIIADDIFGKFPSIEWVPLFNVSDPNFPNHHPDPAVEENLSILKEKVKELHADLGIAFDGDGDRVGVVDNLGRFVSIDKYMILIWRYLVHVPGIEKKTFYDVKCSLALREELDRLGVKNSFYRTGNSYTKEKSYLGNYPFAGELSGHVYFRDKFNGYDDGIYAGLRLVEILSYEKKSISHLLEGIPVYYSTPEVKIPVLDEKKFRVVSLVEEYCASKKYDRILIDGVKVFFSDGSALVRASNTGPNLTVRYEAKTKERLAEIREEFDSLIQEFIQK